MTDRLSILLHSLSVRRGDKWVLRGISWRLRPRQRWALLGGNGAGKTQLLKLLSGDVWPTPGAGERRYRLARADLDLIDAKARIAYVGAEQQDKYARYGWNLRVRDLVATGLHRTDLLLKPVAPSEAKRVAAALRACGLQRHAQRKFLSLSYGQKRIVLLARALVQEPDWLLLDEFYNGLDTEYRRRIDALLDAARRRGQSWVATAHRAIDVPHGTQHVLELDAGRARAAKRIRRADLRGLADRAHGARPKRAGAGNRALPHDQRVLRGDKNGWPGGQDAQAKGAALLSLSKVDLYVDYRPVLLGIDWQLRKGEHWAIYGANGSGKSSFLKLLYGDLAPALGGSIRRAGLAPGSPIAAWKRRIGFVSPELQCDYAIDVSVSDLVASGRYASIGLVDAPTPRDRSEAARWLEFFGLSGAAKRRPRELSYGQLRRALLARALAARPRMLLLDEPLTGLDPRQRALMKGLLERLMTRLTLIIAVHHAEDLPRGMTHAVHLHNRRARSIDPHSANESAALPRKHGKTRVP